VAANINKKTIWMINMSNSEFLSISIDTVSSTLIKTKINSICKTEDIKEYKTNEFYNYLINCEKQLYNKLFNDGLLDKIYLVKSLGDELWYIVDMTAFKNHDEKKTAIRKIVSILQQIASETQILNISERKLNYRENNDLSICKKLVKDSTHLSRKITIDLIEDAYDFSQKRQEMMRKFYESIVWNKYNNERHLNPNSSPHDDFLKEYTASIENISHSLNLGNTKIQSINDEKIKIIYENSRFDLIGRDVDKFFRITKNSISGLVMSGENLYNKYLHDKREKSQFNKKNNIKIQIEFPGIKKKIPQKQLKGICEDYTVFYLPYKYMHYPKPGIFENAINLLEKKKFISTIIIDGIKSLRQWNESKWLY